VQHRFIFIFRRYRLFGLVHEYPPDQAVPTVLRTFDERPLRFSRKDEILSAVAKCSLLSGVIGCSSRFSYTYKCAIRHWSPPCRRSDGLLVRRLQSLMRSWRWYKNVERQTENSAPFGALEPENGSSRRTETSQGARIWLFRAGFLLTSRRDSSS
jgi:hypothetical protein